MWAITITIATGVLREALATRMLLMLGAALLAGLGLAAFVGQLALTESLQAQSALTSALLRLIAVFLLAGFTVTSIAREHQERGHTMLLALPIPRAAYYAGKLAGFALVALAPALLFGGLALLAAPVPAALVWSVSLLCELWIVAAFALLAALGLSSVLGALAASAAFYLLARAIGGLTLLARQRGGAWTWFDWCAAALPRLDLFTRADWLAYGDAGLAELAPVLVQTALYLPLLAALALFDLYRREC